MTEENKTIHTVEKQVIDAKNATVDLGSRFLDGCLIGSVGSLPVAIPVAIISPPIGAAITGMFCGGLGLISAVGGLQSPHGHTLRESADFSHKNLYGSERRSGSGDDLREEPKEEIGNLPSQTLPTSQKKSSKSPTL